MRLGSTRLHARRHPRDRRDQPRPARARCSAASSARISITGWASSRSRCRRCASGSTTSWSWPTRSSREIGETVGRPAAGIARDAKDQLLAYAWPGNVRELRNAIERAVILADGGYIRSEHLPVTRTRAVPRRPTRRPARRCPPAASTRGDRALAGGQGADAGAPQQDARRQAARPDARAAVLAHREVRARGDRVLSPDRGSCRCAARLSLPAVALLFIVLAGATYQGVATALERRRVPASRTAGRRRRTSASYLLHRHGTPDRRARGAGGGDVGGVGVGADRGRRQRRASAATTAPAWAGARRAMRRFRRRLPVTAASAAAEADERGPFIIVGAELGAALARLYASRYPDDTVALVLVNVPGATIAVRPETPSRRFLTVAPWLARTGVLRATRVWSSSVRGLPAPAAGELRAFLNRPDHLTRASGELARWDDAIALSEAAPLRRDLPVVQVQLEGTDRIGMLADRRNAGDVSDAIVRAVRRARSSR